MSPGSGLDDTSDRHLSGILQEDLVNVSALKTIPNSQIKENREHQEHHPLSQGHTVNLEAEIRPLMWASSFTIFSNLLHLPLGTNIVSN